jgi:hypothetical protein
MINLSIHRFTLLNKAKEQQVLSFYNEEEDLLDTMNDFCSHIYKNIREYTDNQGKYRTFTLSVKQNQNADNRTISGFFDSAYTGEKGKIKDRQTNKLKYDISKKDLFSKDFFFLIHVPKNSKFGFLIVQRKENHGIKSVFENAFNSFMRAKGVSNYFLELKQAPARYFIINYLNNGNLKEFRLIENEKKSNDIIDGIDLGREERIFKFNSSFNDSQNLKEVLIKLFDTYFSPDEKIPFLNKGEFDEIVFVLGHLGSSKTFYVRNQDKIRSNVDVTSLVKYEDGEPTVDSLIKISLELINFAA